MMINKRLIGTVAESKKYIAGNVASQWVSLCSNVVIMGSIANFIGRLAFSYDYNCNLCCDKICLHQNFFQNEFSFFKISQAKTQKNDF